MRTTFFLRRFACHVLVSAIAVAVGFGIIGFADLDPAFAKKPSVYAGLIKGVAVGGYDAVSYFDGDAPTRGSAEITAEHDGAVWYFSSSENRDAFQENPEHYAPRYGGYCAYAVSRNYTAKGDPEAWSVVDGRLYLNFNKSVRRTWAKNAAANIEKADNNWPSVLEK